MKGVLGSFVGLLLCAGAAEAQTVLHTQADAGNGGYTVDSGVRTADDFTLSHWTQLTSFEWYLLRTGTTGPATISSSFYWQILADEAYNNRPGFAIHEGTVTAATGTKSGTCCTFRHSYDTYRFAVDLTELYLGPGTYWLAITNAATEGSITRYWSTAAHDPLSGGRIAHHLAGEAGFREARSGASAFTIYGPPVATPEPATLILLATGLLGVGIAARRRRHA